MQGDEFGMKIKKILTKVFVGCVLGTAVITNALSAAASDMVASTVIDFSDSSWNNFSGSGEVTQIDGTKVNITKQDGANIGVKDSTNAGFVTNLNGAEKYLQYDATTGSGANVLTITPKSALTEDFSFEFKAAGKNATDKKDRYMSVVMIPEGSEIVAGTTVLGWNRGYMYDTGTGGNGSRWPNNTTNLQLIIPNWGTTTKYSIGYSATDFRSYKVDVHFNNGNPTFDLWGFYAAGTGFEEDEEGRQLLLKNVKFAEKDGYNKTSVDYSKGFGSIRIEMGAGTKDEGIAIADMKISQKAKIILSDIFSDNMVIPKAKPFSICGAGLGSGAEISAQIIDDEDNVIDTATTNANQTGSFACIFADSRSLETGKSYKLFLKSGTIEKTINNVAAGEIWVFGGSESLPSIGKAASNDNNRLFVLDKDGQGQWKYAKDCAGFGVQIGIADKLSEKSGNTIGAIVGLNNAEKCIPDGIIYLASAKDIETGLDQFDDYIDIAEKNNIKIVYTVPYNKQDLSVEEFFNVMCKATELEKKNYNILKRVPVAETDAAAAITERIANAAYNNYVSLIDYELSVDGNKAYLLLSDDINDVYKDDFCGEDTSGKIYSAENAEKNGNVIELTFNTSSDIIKIYYGKNGVTKPIYSNDGKTVLSPFASNYDAKEEFNFDNSFDRARFCKLYAADISKFSDKGLAISEDTELERDKIGFSSDKVDISMSASGRGKFYLLINGEKLFENQISDNTEISIRKENDGLTVNGQLVDSNIEKIDNIKIKFSDIQELYLTKFKIAMPQYSEALDVIIGLQNLPDYSAVTYNDVAAITELIQRYDSLGGEKNSIFSVEINEKVKKLRSYCENIETEKQRIGEKIKTEFSINKQESYRAMIKLNNLSSLVSYDIECLAVVYDSDGAFASISSVKRTVLPSESMSIDIVPDLSKINNGYVNYYVINDIASGFLIDQNIDNKF